MRQRFGIAIALLGNPKPLIVDEPTPGSIPSSLSRLRKRTRSAVALFFGAFIAEGFIGGTLGKWDLARLVDPLGYTALHTLWTSYNPLQKNTLLVGLEQGLASNRLLWLGVALTILTLAYLRFRFAHQTGGGGWGRGATIDDVPAVRWTRATVPAARRTFGAATRMRQLVAIAARSFCELLSSKGWWIVPIMAVVFVITAPEVLEVELGTPGAATTARVAAILGAGEMARSIAILIALSAGELVWREREARINSIADVTPVPEWLSFLGKLAGLALMLAVAQLIFTLGGVTVQAMLGFHAFDVPLYFTILFGFQLSGYLLFAALAMVVHVLINKSTWPTSSRSSRYRGAARAGIRARAQPAAVRQRAGVVVFADGRLRAAGRAVALVHVLLERLGAAVRGGEVSLLDSRRGARPASAPRARAPAPDALAAIGAAALAIIIGAGGFVFYNTNVLNRYYTDGEIEQRHAEYERRYGKYAAIPQPVLAATKLHVDFFPERSTATIRGTYRLANRSGAPIDTIHVTPHFNVETSNVSFDRPSRNTLTDLDLGYRIYALDKAVRPGESIRMHFQVDFAPRGFRNDGRDPSVMHNGSWIEHRGEQAARQWQWLPAVGYQPARELNVASDRKEHGLRARPAIAPYTDAAARRDPSGHEKIAFEAIVGTSADQIGVATGTLRRNWSENGRNYAHYVADTPISNGYAIYSANYAVHRAAWRDVAIEIFHHPAHTANLERRAHSARVARLSLAPLRPVSTPAAPDDRVPELRQRPAPDRVRRRGPLLRGLRARARRGRSPQDRSPVRGHGPRDRASVVGPQARPRRGRRRGAAQREPGLVQRHARHEVAIRNADPLLVTPTARSPRSSGTLPGRADGAERRHAADAARHALARHPHQGPRLGRPRTGEARPDRNERSRPDEALLHARPRAPPRPAGARRLRSRPQARSRNGGPASRASTSAPTTSPAVPSSRSSPRSSRPASAARSTATAASACASKTTSSSPRAARNCWPAPPRTIEEIERWTSGR